MAPGRRRGSGKAAVAAAAAQKQWNVGDLVLAKMKGFPAWPAMISDPKKWGYSSEKKKLLVYFYGTEQIAFCNYADIEAFTEEKKKSLLNKRHGKGADFVRAINEIVDVYEKLKSNDHTKSCSGIEVVLPDLEGCKNNNGIISEISHGQISELHVLEKHGDQIPPQDDSKALIKVDFCDPSVVTRSGTGDPSIVEGQNQASLTTFKKRSRDGPLKSCTLQSAVPSSSSTMEQTELLDSNVESICADEVCGAFVVDIKCEESISRTSQSRDENSASVTLFVVENGGTGLCRDATETITVSKQCSFLSNCEPDSQNGCLKKDSRKIKGLDPMRKTVIVKKKRNPNRSRVNTALKSSASGGYFNSQSENKDRVVESQDCCKELRESCNLADGDEHLPLVKRARVRKGEPLVEPTIKTGGEVTEDLVIDKDNTNGKESSNSSFPIAFGGESDMKSLQVAYQLKSISRDFEAALPPSKRLHRALEAMSANVADGKSDLADLSNSRELVLNGSMETSKEFSCYASKENMEKTQESNISLHDMHPDLTSKSSSCVGGKILEKQLVKSSEFSTDLSVCGEIQINDVEDDSCNIHDCMKDASDKNTGDHTSLCNVKPVDVKSSVDLGCRSPSQHLNECTSSDIPKEFVLVATLVPSFSEPSSKMIASEFHASHSDFLSVKDDLSFQTSESRKLSSSHTCINAGERYMQDVTEVVQKKYSEKENQNSLDVAHTKVSIAAVKMKQSVSPSFSTISYNLEKSISDSSANRPLSRENSSSERGSPAVLHPHAVETRSNDGPVDFLRQSNPHRAKHYPESDTVWKSFGAALRTLSRTKENIGRATRLAIDCAKFGLSAEVVDLLVKTLEEEPNLNKRIDLFFLVDSISQHSRMQRGLFGDVYLSLFESVLPRLLSFAAPPGPAAWENRRQCLKVLKLWLDRKTLSESVLKYHIRELDFLNEMPVSNQSTRRPVRTERAFNDPVREMEGMLDEYGSNAGFQLSGLFICHALEEDGHGSSSDEKFFESVTPERKSSSGNDDTTMIVKHLPHVLEDVDGELEMEDVSPCTEVRTTSQDLCPDVSCSQNLDDQGKSLPFLPPLPVEMPPSLPPLPSSPPPLAFSLPAMDPDPSNMYSSKINIENHVVPPPPPPLTCQPANNVILSSEPPSNPVRPYYSQENGEDRKPTWRSFSSFICSRSCHEFRPAEGTSSANYLTSVATTQPFLNKLYSVMPPQPSFSNQFSYVRAEGNQKGLHLCHDSHQEVKYHHSDRYRYASSLSLSGVQESRFSPSRCSGNFRPEKVKALPMIQHFSDHPSDPSVPNQWWSDQPRVSNRHSGFSMRPPLGPPISRVERAHNTWRPR